jgi:hypothetical protein
MDDLLPLRVFPGAEQEAVPARGAYAKQIAVSDAGWFAESPASASASTSQSSQSINLRGRKWPLSCPDERLLNPIPVI